MSKRNKAVENSITLNEEFKARTPGQYNYLRTMTENIVTFGIGPAGTGKSYCAIGLACQYLLEQRVDRIIITRPCIEAAPRSLGALPGSLEEKVAPYLRPAVEHMKRFLGRDRFLEYFHRDDIVIEPLEFMRGRTFDNAFIIGEEFQNATTEQIKMFITRIGKFSKIVIDGDIEQADVKRTNSDFPTDLEYVIHKIEKSGIENFGVFELGESDIQRHEIIGPFLRVMR